MGNYLMGVEIIETIDKVWFDLFSKVHDFINESFCEFF